MGTRGWAGADRGREAAAGSRRPRRRAAPGPRPPASPLSCRASARHEEEPPRAPAPARYFATVAKEVRRFPPQVPPAPPPPRPARTSGDSLGGGMPLALPDAVTWR